VQGAAEYQSVLAQTEAVIKSTGGAAGFTVKEMEDLAASLSAANGQSLFTDDQLLSAQNVLATFTEIKGVNFSSATEAIANLSQAMGQDLQSSAVQVGKALNNPTEGLTALTRVGVSFTEEQKKAVEALMETGNVADAQKVILGELERQFGGSASAATAR
jgi:phage-related minor tail protein